MRRRVDPFLAFGIVGLVLFGAIMIYSASVIVGITQFNDPQYFFKREIMYAILGLVIFTITANVHYDLWRRYAKWLFVLTFVLLISVFVFSRGAINGAHRWIYIGSLSLQPSELVKFTFIAYLAAWFAERKDKVTSITQTLLPFLGVCAVLAGLMLLEPDFGTLTVIMAGGLAVFWVAGMSWKQIGIVAAVSVVVLGGVLSVPYRRQRVVDFLHSNQSSSQSGTQTTDSTSYQVQNISVAIGSGGWFGLGFGQSKQKRLFLPEPHTDSIFAIITEELGFVISGLLILAIGFVLYRGYRIATYAPDTFSRLLASGITTWFGYQAFLNLAAMLQLLPLKGVPLPFISYGGTNLIISLFAAGVLLNISRYLDLNKEEKTATNVLPKRKRQVRYG